MRASDHIIESGASQSIEFTSIRAFLWSVYDLASKPLDWLEAAGGFTLWFIFDLIADKGFVLDEAGISLAGIMGALCAALLTYALRKSVAPRVAATLAITEFLTVLALLTWTFIS